MAELQVRELRPTIGAEVEGLDLRTELDSETVRALRELFDDRGFLLIRSADLGPEDQSYLTGLLVGDAPPTDRAAAVANTHLYANYVTNRDKDGYAPFGELLFHCDMMWADSPVQALSLYGMQVELPSVPTNFASMVNAVDALPADLRARVEPLSALHMTGQQRRGKHKDQLVHIEHETVRTTVKPVVWQHPRTQRPILYVSQQMTASIEGLDADESEALLEELFSYLYAPDNVVGHGWGTGDLVVWDNLGVQHARANVEFEGPERTLRKVIAPVPENMGIRKPAMVQVDAG